MVVRKTKKKRRLKGSMGFGEKKKNRGHGHKGGRGKSGTKKHKKFGGVVSHISKKGFSGSPTKIEHSVINVSRLEELALSRKEKEIDLTKMGVDKLLGKGRIATKLKVRVKNISKTAKEKIINAGGEVLE
jgi:large subunit ribosomal protein L15